MDKRGSINKVGFWGAILFAITGLLYGGSMGYLMGNYSIPEYIHAEQFLNSIDAKFIDLYSLSQGIAFISTFFFIVVLCSVYQCVHPTKKITSLLSICFGCAFMILASLNYFVQFTIVRQSIHQGALENIESIVQFNPNSLMNAVNMLAWTLFLGLTCFLIGILIKGEGVSLLTRLSFLATSFFCFIGLVGFVFDQDFLQLIFQFGMTAGLTVGSISISFLFKGNKIE